MLDHEQQPGGSDHFRQRVRPAGPVLDRMDAAATRQTFVAGDRAGDAPGDLGGQVAGGVTQEIPPSAASANETTGLKCAPETGPNIKMIANSPAAVAAAFSSSSSPVSHGDSRCAAIPDPITTAARNALPRNSAASTARQVRCTGHGKPSCRIIFAQSRLTQWKWT